MCSNLSRGRSVRRFHASGRAVAVAATLALGACSQVGDLNLSLAGEKEPETKVAQTSESELQKATAYWGKEASKNPKDGKASLNFARNLKAQGRKQEALAALQAGYMYQSDNPEFLSEYGRLALEQGQVGTAGALLERADDPQKPDWRVISARGVVLAKQGQHKDSIPFFERALELAPTQASVKNNLAMAYTMDGQAGKAEELLRQARDAGNNDPRVKQNLALVLGLQGKHAEAKSLDTPPPAAKEIAAPIGPSTPAEQAVERVPLSEPAVVTPAAATPIATASLDADNIIRAAMDAEAAKVKKRDAAAKAAKRKAIVTAAAEDAPSLKPAKR